MRTKYIKVAVSDRLPEESDYFNTDDGWVQFNKYDKKFWLEGVYEVHPQYWLEEVPDHEEEMREMLEECLKSFNWICDNCKLPAIDEENIEDQIHYIGYRKQELETLLTKINKQS
ncbi:hypothetical protein [Chryseobacterium rhizosphaerae]|uniref:hypothetical protein n=1 Tax=Chryseobacterium rhizosphaerae TaxID=395937 RepID=UPI003D09FB6B